MASCSLLIKPSAVRELEELPAKDRHRIIAHIQGLAGQMFIQFALVVIFSIAISLLDALTVVPMLASRLIKEEQVEEWGDPWVHGITANKNVIDTYIQYNVEQGHLKSPLSYEQLFAASTLDT